MCCGKAERLIDVSPLPYAPLILNCLVIMKYTLTRIPEQLKKAVETADRKLIALHRRNRHGSVKTKTWDLAVAGQERLEAYLFERNARAQRITNALGKEVYPQRTFDDYRRMAEEADRREGTLKEHSTVGGYLDEINRMDRTLVEIYAGLRQANEPRPAIRTEAARLLGRRNILAMKYNLPPNSLEYYKAEAEKIRAAEEEARRKANAQNLQSVTEIIARYGNTSPEGHRGVRWPEIS